jgi:hypothetical protein
VYTNNKLPITELFHSDYFICLGSRNSLQHFPNTFKLIWHWRILHSEDHASWYILIMKDNEMHCFSDLFDKVLYMFQTCPLSIIRSISTLYKCNRYLSF